MTKTRKFQTFDEFHSEQMKNPAFAAAYDEIEPEAVLLRL